jgi:adenosylhomocysteine nucleosidase
MHDISISDPCVLFALGRESAPFLREFRPHQKLPGAPCWARFCGPSWLTVLVLRMGIGPGAAERALAWLMKSAQLDDVPVRPKLVLMAGFAGALRQGLRAGDVVLATEVVDAEGQRWATSWPGELPSGEWVPPLHRGAILTCRRVIVTAEEKRSLGEQHKAIAVDMETAVVAHWCQRMQVPFGAVRSISDDVNTSLSPRLAALISGGNVSLFRVLPALARSPGLLPELMRLKRDTATAALQLGRALGELLTLATPWGDESAADR